MAETHTVMPKKLAQALMEAGMKHFDGGGLIGSIGGAVQGIGSDFTAQNNYQAQLAPTQTSNYQPLLGTAQSNALAGYGNSQQIQAQQQSLANTLLAQSQGQGPNVAQSALNQNTGNNIAAQGALIASQRGASANPALLARQIAQQGAATQQQAVGQGATLQAQQQIAAQQALAAQQGQIAQQNLAEQGVNAGLVGTAAGAQNAQNNTAVNNYGMTQGINSGVAAANAAADNKTISGLPGAIGSAIAGPIGGIVKGIGSGIGSALGLAKGGKVQDGVPEHLRMLGEIYHPQRYSDTPMNMMSTGGGVPGKPAVEKNSKKNDVVPALLSPEEVVLPISVTQAKDAPKKAAEFMKHIMEKDGDKGYKKVVQARAKKKGGSK